MIVTPKPLSYIAALYDGTEDSVADLPRYDGSGITFEFGDLRPNLAIDKMNSDLYLVVKPGQWLVAFGGWYLAMNAEQYRMFFELAALSLSHVILSQMMPPQAISKEPEKTAPFPTPATTSRGTVIGLILFFLYPPLILVMDAGLKFILHDETISMLVWSHPSLQWLAVAHMIFWAVALSLHFKFYWWDNLFGG